MPLDTYLGLRAFVDELARCGVTHACISPGSRNTPLLLSLVRDGRLECSSHLDERSGGFFGVGVARATRRPVVLCCTSGTAAANYHPAVIEAWEAGVPLIVMTADRPVELRDVGAGQTIDQVKLYGRAAKWFVEVDDAPATPARVRWMRQLACRAWAAASGDRPGPVHLNFALREPLVLDEPLPTQEPGGGGRPGGQPWTRWDPAPAPPPRPLVAELERRPRAVVVAGAGADGPAVAGFAARAGLPLLADPLSGARLPGAIAHYDLLLRSAEWTAAHVPELVVRIGDLPTSKPLRSWLAGLDGARQVTLDARQAWQDPAGSLHAVLAAGVPGPQEPLPEADAAWPAAWRRADAAAAAAIRATLGDGLSEPAVAARLAARVPRHGALVVASSMPIRDVEAFAAAADGVAPVHANRGANGIDGTISTAFGVAAVTQGPTALLTGDLALLYDVGGLAAASREGIHLTIVVLNNDGGGIFHFLPVAGEGADFERHVATPHGLDLAGAAALYGCELERPGDLGALDSALDRALGAPRTTLVEVRTDRRENRELHARLAAAVADRIVREAA